jgi:predicted PurR-regulated permease PerM
MILTAVTATTEVIGVGVGALFSAGSGIGNSLAGLAKNIFTKGNSLTDIIQDIGSDFTAGYDTGSSLISSVITPVTGLLNSVISMGQTTIVNYSNWLSNTINLMSDTFTNVYQDGVTETKFGEKMEIT